MKKFIKKLFCKHKNTEWKSKNDGIVFYYSKKHYDYWDCLICKDCGKILQESI